jgi:FkbM family methyltransferase
MKNNMRMLSLIKKIPKVKKFISFHNPSQGDLIKRLGILTHEKPMVIDIGANTGQTIDYILSINPNAKINSFEPTFELITKLKAKYKLIGNVQIFDIALGDMKGVMNLYTSEFSPTNSLLPINIELYKYFESPICNALENCKIENCNVETFDNWYNKNTNQELIDLMKIDTQGTEYNVLKGSLSILQNKVKAVILELHYLNFYKGSVPFYESVKLLYENNFYLYSFFDNHKLSNLQLLENNALFLNRNFVKETYKKK